MLGCTDKPKKSIVIELPDGSKREGIAWETTALQIATDISKGLAKAAIVAKARFTNIFINLL